MLQTTFAESLLLGHRVLWSLDFGVGVFHDFSRMNFGGNELMQGRTLTPQQVREMQKGFDLSTGQASRWIPLGICHSRCRFGCMRCALTGKLKFGFFMMGKRLRIAEMTNNYPVPRWLMSHPGAEMVKWVGCRLHALKYVGDDSLHRTTQCSEKSIGMRLHHHILISR